jgi:hypothetical protein
MADMLAHNRARGLRLRRNLLDTVAVCMRTRELRVLFGVKKSFMKAVDRWLVLLAYVLLLQNRHESQYISLSERLIPRGTRERSFAPLQLLKWLLWFAWAQSSFEQVF